MKVSDFIAQKLAEAGIDTAFLVQGAANNDLIYSIADRKDMRYVCPMHEQAAGFMAEGWSKVTGLPGLAIGTSGPGGQNLLTPICNFFYDSVPGIFITGQVNSQFMRPSAKLRQVGFQEWPAADCFAPVTKWSYCVRDPAIIPWALGKALWLCQEGRPGPVVLDIPLDVQRAQIEPDRLQTFTEERPFRSAGMHDQIVSFIHDFRSAKRPVILIGGGVRDWEAEGVLEMLAEIIRVPIFPTWNALDMVSSDHPWYGGRIGTYGGAGRNFGVQNCDLLLAIGCRLSGRITGGNVQSFARGAKRYVVDVDPALLRSDLQQLPFHVNIRSDAATFMQTLERALRRCYAEGWPMPDHSEWVKLCFSWRDRYDPALYRRDHSGKDLRWDEKVDGVHPYAFVRALSEALPANAIIVYDCGGNAVVMNHAFKTKKGQRYFSNNGNSPMGFAFCGALGAWFAEPERPIICVIGDGGFNMNIQEVQTLINYGAKVKTFILDNRVYGITKAFQETHFGSRFEASGPKGYKPPDFEKVCSSYGVASWRCRAQSEVKSTIFHALTRDEGCVVIVESPEFRTYEPKINGWATPIEDMWPWLSREEFRANMLIEPLPGWEKKEYGPYHV